MFAVLAFVFVFPLMLVEAWRAGVNERTQRARGGVEPDGDVYAVMQVAYPAAFLLMIAEGALRGDSGSGNRLALAAGGAIVFAFGKAIKWWAIATLGRAWTFRVIVVPGDALVTHGPYRWLRHPNYVGVIAEFLGVALMAGAAVTGPIVTVLFGLLIRKRIAVEERTIAAAIIRK